MTAFQNTGQPDWNWWRELWPDPATVLQQLGLTEGQSVIEAGLEAVEHPGEP